MDTEQRHHARPLGHEMFASCLVAALLVTFAQSAQITIESGGSIVIHGGAGQSGAGSEGSAASPSGSGSESAPASLTAEVALLRVQVMEMARVMQENGMAVPTVGTLPPAGPPPPPSPRTPLLPEMVNLGCDDNKEVVMSWVTDGVMTIPEGVEVIEDDFGNCYDRCAAVECSGNAISGVTSIVFPSTVKRIGTVGDGGDEPFFYLTGINSVDFSQACSLEYVGDETFYLSSLTGAVELPCCLSGTNLPTIEGSSYLSRTGITFPCGSASCTC